jgi:ATP-dependent helicase/nuclease subunit A
VTRPALRVDGRRVDAPAFYAAACDPARSCVVEAVRRLGQDLDAGLAHAARAARRHAAARDPGDHLHARRGGEMRERLDQWLADFSTPRSTHEQRVRALVDRGVDPARAEALAPELGTLQGRVLAAGRAVEIRTFHGWFAQLLRSAPLALLDRLGVQADAELVEDWREHRPAVHRAFHAELLRDEALRADHAAATAARGRHQLRVWLDTVWDRRVEFELADEAGVLATSVERAEDVWPELAAYAHPPSRSRPRRGPTPARRGARARLGARQAGAGRGRRACRRSSCAAERFAAVWSALFT